MSNQEFALYVAVQRVLGSGVRFFTTDEVWEKAASLPWASEGDPRALGNVMKRFIKRGTVKKHGYVPTRRPEAHGRPVRLYEVLP